MFLIIKTFFKLLPPRKNLGPSLFKRFSISYYFWYEEISTHQKLRKIYLFIEKHTQLMPVAQCRWHLPSDNPYHLLALFGATSKEKWLHWKSLPPTRFFQLVLHKELIKNRRGTDQKKMIVSIIDIGGAIVENQWTRIVIGIWS